ncbi:hypothetical protein HRJ35_11835 [Shewanella oneidensis MR-1]|uniref:Predicted secreted protein n=1 Tax=Shewanella oneidensis (strain ATCC 700550 / JCM 31522 / CIP 106686 / LMG 19005 / NCIMB 14063 / MR-1) TaxID=211586 RepID=Q8EFH0_SHEON|nr:hypothetical protein [Shewanella oneidensis]AAN55053.1 predicted secreted protein [Shewanella oneidensis MR-1]MDX5996246.1 hypothetical protein [Shewanella oneidensis]MEE2029371.1 hypothetical protein [Shewanella oneidensis]QKG96634.1 hypothetical protein HRJ35_11835 [Shewanella oneidensis MR-1]
MKKLTLVTSAVLFSSLVLAGEPHEQSFENEQQAVGFIGIATSFFANEIISAATSAIKSGLQSALKNAIFGKSAPNYVTLSEESLAAIENIVQTGFDTYVHDDMISKIGSLEEAVKAYNDSLLQGKRFESMVTQLEVRSHDLSQSPAFWNTKSYYADLTIQESLAASLSYAIYADKVHYGEISKAYLEYLGNSLADKIEARGAAELKISQNITMTSRATNCDMVMAYRAGVESANQISGKCKDYIVSDRFSGKTYFYRYVQYGPQNGSEAYNHISSLKSQYQVTLKGKNYNQVISTLRTTY